MNKILLVAIVIAACMLFPIARKYFKVYKIKKLKKRYLEALKASDKELALKRGKTYYRFMRNGSITIYDEITIAEEIATMKENNAIK